ncbi:MAG: PDZ domain-containing protein [Planctomycetota bacterium]
MLLRPLPLALVTLSVCAVARADEEAARRRALAERLGPSLVRVEARVRVNVTRLPGVGPGARRTHTVSLPGVVVGGDGLVACSALDLDPARVAYALLGSTAPADVVEVRVAGADGRIRAATWLGRDPGSQLAFLRLAEPARAGLKPLALPEQAPRPALGDPLYALYLAGEDYGYQPAVEETRVAVAHAPHAALTPPLPHAHGALLVDREGGVLGLLLPGAGAEQVDPLRPDRLAAAATGRLVGCDVVRAAAQRPPKEPALGGGGGRRARAWLGTRTKVVTPELAKSLGLDVDVGVYVEEVLEGAGRAAGLAKGDVLLRLDGEPLDLDPGHSFDDLIGDYVAGDEVKLLVRRAGKNQELSAKLGSSPLRPEEAARLRIPELGLTLRALTFFDPAAATLESAPPGAAVVLDLDPDGAASRAGLRIGDAVLGVGDEPAQTLEDLRRLALREGPQPLKVRRDGKDLTLNVRR